MKYHLYTYQEDYNQKDNKKFLSYLQDKIKPKPLHTAGGIVNSKATVQREKQKAKEKRKDISI